MIKKIFKSSKIAWIGIWLKILLSIFQNCTFDYYYYYFRLHLQIINICFVELQILHHASKIENT
jgi:hypothetical protein